MNPDIFSFIKSRENEYESQEIRVGDNWSWNMRDHIQLIFHLKNGIFYKGENDYLRAFKQIMRPLLRLSYWMEDLEVKDVVFYSEDKVLSFLIKKYHDEVYVKEHNLDELFDDITEADIDYGGVLVQKGVEMPEVIPLQQIAFCDQTNILGGPIGFKYYFSPDKLRSMEKYGWGKESNGATISLEELSVLARAESSPAGESGGKNVLPGKTVEVVVVRGSLPETYMDEEGDPDYWFDQLQIVAFYTKEGGKYDGKEGCILYRKKEDEGNVMFHSSEKVTGRGLGYSDGEAFIHPQIWSNFLTIHKMNFLEAGSKVPFVTDDPNFANKNKIDDIDNNEILTINDGKSLRRLEMISPANVQLLSNAVDEWFNHSQLLGSAFDPVLGKEPVSGTTFRGQERTVSQGRGWHDRRRGKRAKFIEEIYRKFILTDIKREINSGTKFFASLSSEELSWVADNVATNLVNKKIKTMILAGKKINPEEQQVLLTTLRDTVLKNGRDNILESIKGEFDDMEIKIGINIAGKQKDLALLSDKLLSIFQFIFSNPQAFQQSMQIPALAKTFGDIVEYSGLSMANFSSLITPATPSPATPAVESPVGKPVTPSPMVLNRNEEQ